MTKSRQQLMFLHLSGPSLESGVVAWALYDGAAPASARQMQSGDEEKPPYRSVLDAMRDGWFVMQCCNLPHFEQGHEHETGHLPYEYILERRVEIDCSG